MLTLEQAINKYREAAHEKQLECVECRDVNDLDSAQECYELALEYEQLSKWLTLLKVYDDFSSNCAYWINDESSGKYICSNCNSGVPRGFVPNLYDFCPHCGKKMSEDK